MTIKELKALFEGCDENENVCIDDVNGKTIRICGGGERSVCGIVLSVHQEFPDEWFDQNGNEVRWINGVRVRLNYEPLNDDMELDLEEFGTREISLNLHDGWAVGEGVRLVYPKLADLTDEQIEKLDDLLGHRITESGNIGFDDVALEFGKVVKYTPPVKKLDRDSHLACESIQEVTLVAWPMIYGKDNEFDLDSRNVLETFRFWGMEFESWWMAHTEEWRDAHDYIEEVERFAQAKADGWITKLRRG